ncbi:Cytochrome oxidase biogenesis protein Surf1, facilitates heme A insertion [Actinomycetales bacterium JB111]|nr:Cytochrome oxidase biogenesis protein Surf1, facilitates heme A insertion [Actinomycetales bacterium JB111]
MHPDDAESAAPTVVAPASGGRETTGKAALAEGRSPAAIAAAEAAERESRTSVTRAERRRRNRVSLRELWRSAISPRMIGLLALLLAAAVVCVQLSAWQLDRAALRGADRAVAAHAATLAAAPVPLEDVLRAQSSFSSDQYAVGVVATGEWEPANQVLVPGRGVDGEDAVLVVAAFRITAGPDSGALLPVLRGWIPAADVDLSGERAAVADEDVYELPPGEVEVTGHLANAEQHHAGEIALPGTATSISPSHLASQWGGPSFSAYLVQGTYDGSAWTHADGVVAHASDPEIKVETGLNIQNLFYAIEWLVFGGFALWLWWRLVRDDALDRRDAALLEGLPGDGASPGRDAEGRAGTGS